MAVLKDTGPAGHNWLALLNSAVEADPRGRAGVAERIGFSRSAISQVLSGTYPADPAKVALAVIDHYDRPACPLAGGIEIERGDCRRKALRPRPFGGRTLLTQWETCQTCPNKPKE